MIKDIKELNFPKIDGKQYATLTQATATLADMGEKTISTQVKIDGEIVPGFSFDWEVEFQGEKYIMPLRIPQGAKENTSLNSTIDLTFQHWAIYQLKRWPFVTIQQIAAGTYLPDEEVASVQLNLKDFCILFGQVLEYYYGNAITIDLNPAWQYKQEATRIEISHTKIWNVLAGDNGLYKLFGVRWEIKAASDNSNTVKGGERYVIRVGYPTTEVDHIFEYGFEGGLLKVERQVQSEEIRNMIKGRGGETNIPRFYFKQVPDAEKEKYSYRDDPDWVEELANIYFPNLMGATFRSYIQGWKAAHINQRDDENKLLYEGYVPVEQNEAYSPWAYRKGYTDTKFSPVEFVADEITINPAEDDKQVEILPGYSPYIKKGSSLDKYGPLPDTLDNNDDIYPTLQGTGMDIAIDVEEVQEKPEDDSGATGDAGIQRLLPIRGIAIGMAYGTEYAMTINGDEIFTVSAGRHANLIVDPSIVRVENHVGGDKYVDVDVATNAEILSETLKVYDAVTGEERSASGIPEGEWRYEVIVKVKNINPRSSTLRITVEDASPYLMDADITDIGKGNTFDIWVRNIWDSVRKTGEDDRQYAERVWKPVLGDREKETAKVVFTSGNLALSEDYEFPIVGYPVPDTSKNYKPKDAQGNYLKDENGKDIIYTSYWRVTLDRSDAELESTGIYVPSGTRQGKAGDTFVFIGTEMTHVPYVVDAEIRLDDNKKDTLSEKKEIKPTYTVTPDRVRLCNEGKTGALIDQLRVGNSIRLADSRLVQPQSSKAYETLYLQSIKYTYREPSSDDAALNPDVEITLGEDYATSANPVSMMKDDISALQRQVGSINNVEQIARAVGDGRYLRKDGISDRSLSPTSFEEQVTGFDFRAGIIGGRGWGITRDANGNALLEIDSLNVRKEMQVNTLVVNNAVGRGGMTIDSAAVMEIASVVKNASGYVCYFDQKGGSVANMFRVGDIALCVRWNAAYSSQKYYRRRVMAVTQESVTLTDGYPATADNGNDTGVDGMGIPTSGDVIIHFGSYTDLRRQSVRIADVVGGVYVRMLEGLDSVKSEGKEYFFAGKQEGQYQDDPRVFVGDKEGQYIEYESGNLTVKAELDVRSTIGKDNIKDYISDHSTALRGIDCSAAYITRNEDGTLSPSSITISKYFHNARGKTASTWGFLYVKQEGVSSEFLLLNDEESQGTLDINPDATGITMRLCEFDDGTGESYSDSIPIITDISELEIGTSNLITNSKGGFTPSRLSASSDRFNTILASTKITELQTGETYTLRAKTTGVFVDDINNTTVNGAVAISVVSQNGQYTQISDSRTGKSGGTTFKWNKLPVANGSIAVTSIGKARVLSELMLVKGNKISSEWSASPADFDYIKSALAQNTKINGGLVLTSRVETGYTDSKGERHTKSGLNGIYEDEKSLALWAGGDARDADNGLTNPATFAIRMDGTGYACNNTVKFLSEELRVGQYDEIRLTKTGLFLYCDGEQRLQIANTSLDIPSDALYNPATRHDSDMTISGHVSNRIPSATFSFPSIEIGSFQTERHLILKIRFSFSLGTGQHLTSSQHYYLDIHIGGKQYTVIGQGSSMIEFERTIETTLQPGQSTLTMTLRSSGISGDPGTYADATGSLSLEGYSTVIFDNMTKVCKNGFISSWNNSVLAITPSAFLAKVGSTAIKITEAGGLQKWKNNQWTDI